MMSKLLAVVIIIAILLPFSGMARVNNTAKGNGLLSEDSGGRVETRVYVRRQCILSAKDKNERELFGALLGIFLPLLIEKALGGVSSALKKAGSKETLRDTGRLPTYLYALSNTVEVKPDGTTTNKRSMSLNPDLGCVIIVRGTFNDPERAGNQSVVDFPANDPGRALLSSDQNDEAMRIARLNQSQIPVQSIAMAYEAAIKKSNDMTALHYEGRFLEVNSFQGSRSSKSPRTLVVSIALHGAGEKEGEPTLSLALLNLGTVTKGVVMGPTRLRNQRSSWLGGLAISESAMAAIEKMEVKDNQTIGVMPVTVEGTFVETEDGNAALRFIAEILDSTKGEVSKAVSGEILKDRGEEAKKKAAEAADALEKLRQAEEEAYANYLKADAELAELGPPPADETPAQKAAREVKKFELERAKRLWCVKYGALSTIGAAPAGRSCP